MSLLAYFRIARSGARSRGVLGMLVLIAAALLCCPVVYADHCKGKHRNDPGCDSGGDEDTWSFYAESSGHVTGMYTSKEYKISGDDHNIVFNRPSTNSYRLGDYFIFHDYDGRSGQNCFVGSSIDRAGSMHLLDEFGSEPEAVARFWFLAENDPEFAEDKVTDLGYRLTLYNFDPDEVWAGEFPPNKESYSVRVATHWELITTKKADSRKEPCVSGGLIPFPSGEVELRVIQNP